jgi:predicted outer membrane repeat protein
MNMTSARRSAAITLVLLLTASLPAASTVITVAEDGSATYLDIQDGIDAASPGDTVSVAAGVYDGERNRDLDFGGVPLMLVAPSGPTQTTIDCESLGRGFFFGSGEDTTALVSGFRITGAQGDSGAGAYCRNGSSPKFFECSFDQNTATDWGGGLCCTASSPVVRDCDFIGNVVSGGTYPYGGAMACLSGAAPLISNTNFDGNLAAKVGGAVYCNSSPASFVQCDFTSNNISVYGYSGAAVALQSTNGATFIDCTFHENGLTETAVGGGIYASGSTITVTDCEFTSNRAGAGAGIHFTSSSTGSVTGCTFADNDSNWSSASGISCNPGCEPTVSGCTFVDNGDWHMTFNNASPVVEHCIFAFATAGVMYCDSGGSPVVSHCVIYENAGSDSLCGENHHDNEWTDPLFCDVDGGDYTLCADSPCLPGVTWPSLVGAHGQGCDACDNAVETATWSSIKSKYR